MIHKIKRRGVFEHPFLFALNLVILLSGCQTVEQRQDLASTLANEAHFHQVTYPTSTFHLYAQEKIQSQRPKIVHVYIEGDGYAWARENRVSTDPTPLDPVALRLASADSYADIIYLARPCQYTLTQTPNLCVPEVWTNARQSRQVLDSYGEALTQAKSKYDFEKIILFGYSGGGGIAAILAAERKDVTKLVTIAGNLDHRAWTTFHEISPLIGSLNAFDYASQLHSLPQVHFVGEKDEIVPAFLTERFLREFPSANSARLIVIPNQNHHSGWEKNWPSLLQIVDK